MQKKASINLRGFGSSGASPMFTSTLEIDVQTGRRIIVILCQYLGISELTLMATDVTLVRAVFSHGKT
jgi:hypothetical protein